MENINVIVTETPEVIKVTITDYQEIVSTSKKLKLIASGGISTFDELPRLANLGCEGVIIGKAIYEKKISLKSLETYIVKNT